MWVFQQARCWVLGVGCSVFGGCLGLNRKPKTKQLPSLWDGRWGEVEQTHLDKTWDQDKVIRRQPETKTNHKISLWWDTRQSQRSDTIAAKWRAMSMGRSQKGVCRHLFMSRTQPVCTRSSGCRHWITPFFVLVMMRKKKVLMDREVLKKRYTNEFVVHGKSEKDLRLQQRVSCLYLNLDICLYQHSSW